MKLCASLIVRDELDRYLPLVVGHLLEFCDEIRVLDDGSTDGGDEWLAATERVHVLSNDGPAFFEHEGRARQRLLSWTLEARPSHVLPIDADELVSDGPLLRRTLQSSGLLQQVFLGTMVEVWRASSESLHVRVDGGWKEHRTALAWRVPAGRPQRQLRIRDRALACGREPEQVRAIANRGRGILLPIEILHLGWANSATRAERHRRYAVHDRGRFHRGSHLASILWPEERVELEPHPWPPALEGRREEILSLTSRTKEAA